MVTAQLVKELREKTGAGMLDCKKALEATDGNVDAACTWLREKGISKAAKKADRIAAEGLCSVVVDGNNAVVFEINSETDFVSKNAQFLDLINKIGNILINSDVKSADEAMKLTFEGKTVEAIMIDATATIGEKISLRRVQRFTKDDSSVFGSYKHMGGRIVSLVVVNGNNETVAKDVAMHVAASNPKYLSQNDIDEQTKANERNILVEQAKNDPKNASKPEAIIAKMIEGRLMKGFKEVCLLDQPFVKNPDETVDAYVKSQKCSITSFVRLEVGEGIEKVVTDFAAEVAAQMRK